MKIQYLLVFVLLIILFACQSMPPVSDNEKNKKDKETEKDFAEVIKDCKVIPGLFTIYHNEKDGTTYLELLPDRLNKIFLCTITRESGDSSFFDSVALGDNFPFLFRKIKKRIQFVHKNVLFRADKDKPSFRALEKGISDSIVASAPIISKLHPKTNALLVSLQELFLIDRENIAHGLNERTKADFSLDKDNSFFSILKSFPDNTDIEVSLHFHSKKPVSSHTSPDARSIILRYYYSLCRLPESDYVPRLADDRVGYFITMFQDYSSVEPETPYVRYIQRWNVEKQDPQSELSPPKKPIVFWLEKTIPVEYREAIKNGVLLWNRAFEKIGFKDAIVVYQQPDDADWDPADVRYNTIRWMINPGAGYAVGPSSADPFTGELYNADIRISADMLRFRFTEFEEFVNPVRNVSDELNHKYCDYAQGLMQQAAFGWEILHARGFLDGKEDEVKKFVEDYLVELTVHEVGHTLGLRHNFKASTIRNLYQLHNKKLTAEQGLIGSVMDYNPVNLSLNLNEQGEYWQTSLGPYDYWAIEYGYKPTGAKTPQEELTFLKEIGSKSIEPQLVYGTDEDTFGNSPRGIDPTCSQYDLGDDILEFAKVRLSLVQEVWGKLEEKFTKPGERYYKMRMVFGRGLGEYSRIASLLVRYIGGIYHHRHHIGTTETSPLKPVEPTRQKEILNFIINNIFNISKTTLVPLRVLNKLAPDMMPDFTGGVGRAASTDIQIHNRILGIQKAVLDYLYHPLVLTRLNDFALRVEKSDNVFGLAELFKTLREAIWKELSASANINSFMRNLQREFTERLIGFVNNPASGIPSDVTALSRNDLVIIQNNIKKTLGSDERDKLDIYTLSHLDEISNRISAVLEWKTK